MPLRKGILGVSSPRVDLTPESDAEEQKQIAKILSVFFQKKNIAERLAERFFSLHDVGTTL